MKSVSRKNSKRDRMIGLKIFETQEVRDWSEKSRRVERLSHLVDGNNRRCLPDGRKGMQRLRKIEI